MNESLIVRAEEGRRFRIGEDTVSIKTPATETNGAYSLMHWTVGAETHVVPHDHERYEETFYVLSGSLNFLLGETTKSISAGDFVRAPAGTRHGFTNVSGKEVELLVGFTPGGMEELFYKFRIGGDETIRGDYWEEAKKDHATEYER